MESLLEHGLKRIVTEQEDPGNCRAEGCDQPGYAKQAFKAPAGGLATVLLCMTHYGLRDIMPSETKAIR